MDKKLKQVTDSIHDTIYLSDLESQLISTPYFYRLHEVYQSSTVYMTFPSNRTKRYEHSLGVMDLTSEIFYSAVANATRADRDSLFDYLFEKVVQIYTDFFDEAGAISVNYCKENAEALMGVMNWKNNNSEKIESSEGIRQLISDIVRNGYIEDKALQHYMICFFNSTISQSDDQNATLNAVVYSFVYQCTLQAVRICALFHDVGHPPYSHVIENVLTKLYAINDEMLKELQNLGKEVDKKKFNSLKKCIDKFEISELDLYKNGLNMLLEYEGDMSTTKMHLHESIGLSMLLNAMEAEFKNTLNFGKNEVNGKFLGQVLYNVVVMEFVFAILLEKSAQFKSLHKIIDGPFDADKLDYVVRDTVNCGVDWGKAPYKRIVDSAVLKKISTSDGEGYVVTYPEKIVDDIEDVLVTRYKIYIRINYHHRVAKTATVLQNAVLILAMDYLCSKAGKELSKDIEYLWKSLQVTNYSKELKIAKWSDSWLISTLYNTLTKIKSDEDIKQFAMDNQKNKDDLYKLRDLLEELLLNKRHYFTLFKRKSDSIEILNKILDRAGITDDVIKELTDREIEKLWNEPDLNGRKQAKDSLWRISVIREAKKRGLFDLLSIALPNDIYEKIDGILKADQDVKDFYIVDNLGRNKFGIQDQCGAWEDKIYLYNDNEVVEYNRIDQLMQQLRALSHTAMEKYCYISFYNVVNINKKMEEIIEQVIDSSAKDIKMRFAELFPHYAKSHLTVV